MKFGPYWGYNRQNKMDSTLFKALFKPVKGILAAMFYCFYTKSKVKLSWIPECLLSVL